MAYNLASLRESMALQHEDEDSLDIMKKCTSSCFISMKEN